MHAWGFLFEENFRMQPSLPVGCEYHLLSIMNSHRLIHITVFLCAFCAPLIRAQERPSSPDTLIYHLTNPLVVTGTRFSTRAETSPTSVYTFSSRQISRKGNSLSDIVRTIPGAIVREYGANGSLNLLSLRGFGPEYTVVYLNGIRLNDAQNGNVDLGRISLLQVDRIEIAPGGFTALYGSDALGGVINVRTNPSDILAHASVATGSFGWTAFTLRGGVSGSIGHVHIGYLSERARNNFSFTPRQETDASTSVRLNSDFQKQIIGVEASISLGLSQVFLYSNYSTADVGVPGAYTGASQGKARQRDDELRSILSWKKKLNETSFLRINAAYNYALENYIDPGFVLNGVSLNSEYKNQTPSLAIHYDNILSDNFHLITGAEFSQSMLSSAEVNGSPRRRTSSLYSSVEYRWQLSSRDADAFNTLRLFPSLRYDYVHELASDKIHSVISPSLGLNMTVISNELFLRGKVAQNFRTPTFNQLYWKQGGNLNLKPEYSTSAEVGLLYQLPDREIVGSIIYFHQDLRNKIVWMPGAGMFWSPRNVQHVVSRGLESSIRWTMHDPEIELDLNGQWIIARKVNASFEGDLTADKQLPNIPNLSASAVLSASFGAYAMNITELIVGQRYLDETNAETLPAHAITNIALQLQHNIDRYTFAFSTEINNLFNQQYEMLALYPMPSRSFRMKLTVTIH